MYKNPQQLLALVDSSPLGNIGEGSGFGPFNFDNVGKSDTAGFEALTKVISTMIGFITVTAGIYFLYQLIIGAYGWMVSSGDKSKLQKAQDRMTHAIIGLIIIVATYGIVGVVGGMLGFDILLIGPGAIPNLINLLKFN